MEIQVNYDVIMTTLKSIVNTCLLKSGNKWWVKSVKR